MADRVARETTYAKSTDQMCREDSCARLLAEEKPAAKKCLSSYCQPVELYNILQRRALKKPLFLQRCLSYNKFDKQRNRVQMKISVSAVDEGQQPINLFPLCIFLARSELTKDSATYHLSRFCLLTAPTEVDMNRQAKFVLPELKKLSEELKRDSLDVLFISCAELIMDHTDPSSFSCDVGGQCFLGRIPMESLLLSWENSSTFSWGERTSFISKVDMHPCLLMAASSDEDKCVSFKFPNMAGDVTTFHQLQANITAEEVGAKWKTSHDVCNYIDVPLPLVSPIKSATTGTVVFKHKYNRNDKQETEATEDFSCPFCLVKCSSYKGVRLHLTASHDLFNFEFGVNADDHIVNVTVKTPRSLEAVGPDPKYEAVFYCSKPQRRRRTNSSVTNARHVHPIVLDSPVSTNGFADKTEGATDCVEHDASSPNTTEIAPPRSQSCPDPDRVLSLPGSNITPPQVVQFVTDCVEHDTSSPNTTEIAPPTAQSCPDPDRVLSLPGSRITAPQVLQSATSKRSDPRNRALLKRQFFHSHTAQPMTLEEVFSDQDSEDEVDDEEAVLEDFRMLDDFVEVTKDEKKVMCLWNSFVRKQRVLPDCCIPWACEAFTKLHGKDFIDSPALLRCWRLFMLELWNYGLLDARALNNCNVILEQVLEQKEHGP